jgi:hypothetical protein
MEEPSWVLGMTRRQWPDARCQLPVNGNGHDNGHGNGNGNGYDSGNGNGYGYGYGYDNGNGGTDTFAHASGFFARGGRWGCLGGCDGI